MMKILEKQFSNKDLEIELTSYIDNKQNVWFRGKDIATILGYSDTPQAIRKNVCIEDKYKGSIHTTGSFQTCVFINESGLYSLILSSKVETAKKFKHWVTSQVLPSIRKYGQYKLFDNPWNKMIMIGNETSLHYQIIKVIRRFYPHALIIAGLGELQDTSFDAYRKGYQRGQADIVIGNKHVSYQGFAIELKNPNNNYQISDAELNMQHIYELNGYKYLCSNDYDLIIKEIHDYMTDIRLSCNHCNKKFKHLNSLNNHHKYFHKITG